MGITPRDRKPSYRRQRTFFSAPLVSTIWQVGVKQPRFVGTARPHVCEESPREGQVAFLILLEPGSKEPTFFKDTKKS